MKTVVRAAAVVLTRDAASNPGRSAPITGQTVAVRKADPQSVIGIDGHTGFWDELVEVHWEGSHLRQLEGVVQVEIRDEAGVIVESLPVDGTRAPHERDGVTVFFLTDPE